MEKIDQLESSLTELRSSYIYGAEQEMLETAKTVLKNFKALRALGDSSNTIPSNHDWTPHADREDEKERHAAGSLHDRLSFLNNKNGASCPIMRQPMLEFWPERTVRAPDFEWLDDTEGFEEPTGARIYRKRPMTPFGRKSERPHVRTWKERALQCVPWKERTAKLTRLLKSVSQQLTPLPSLPGV